MLLKLHRYRGYILHGLDCHLTLYSVGSHITGTSSILVQITSTHPPTDPADVTTQSGLMIDPPQKK